MLGQSRSDVVHAKGYIGLGAGARNAFLCHLRVMGFRESASE